MSFKSAERCPEQVKVQFEGHKYYYTLHLSPSWILSSELQTKDGVFPPGSLWGRVEEQSLWSSRQLGEQSPAALLRSLVYLNTKYFGLRTVEQHLRLSFANVYGPDTVHPVTKETTACIRVPSISQDHHGETGDVYILGL